MNIMHSKVESSGNGGFVFRYFKGNISITASNFYNITTQGSIWIISGNYPEENLKLYIENNSFSYNSRAIEVSKLNNRYRRYTNMWHLGVTDNKFYHNDEVITVWLTSDNHLGKHHMLFQENILKANSRGIVFKNNKYMDLYSWVLVNNTFEHFTDVVLQLKGSGVVDGNLIFNNNIPKEAILTLQTSHYIFIFSNNRVFNNSNSMYNYASEEQII